MSPRPIAPPAHGRQRDGGTWKRRWGRASSLPSPEEFQLASTNTCTGLGWAVQRPSPGRVQRACSPLGGCFTLFLRASSPELLVGTARNSPQRVHAAGLRRPVPLRPLQPGTDQLGRFQGGRERAMRGEALPPLGRGSPPVGGKLSRGASRVRGAAVSLHAPLLAPAPADASCKRLLTAPISLLLGPPAHRTVAPLLLPPPPRLCCRRAVMRSSS